MLPEPAFLLRHDRPGPRYTSYPTAPAWQAVDDARLLTEPIARLRPDEAVSVYVHVPFCKEQCLYCGCHMVVAGRQSAGDRYLDALARQLELLPLPPGQPVVRLHLGGGTPTWLSPGQLRRLYALLATRWTDAPDAVRSVEADPEVTTEAHLDVLAEAGVQRLSFGVQSFDADVLAAVHRPQAAARVAELVDGARARGIHAINLDLMYGLPHQTPATLARTLATAVSMRPDRLAVFGYAHVPWVKPHQARLDATALPDAPARLDLLLTAHRSLRDAGYVPIGFDHFALPDDSLAVAARSGTLQRDFMGYTARPPSAMIGLGPSAISQFDDRFVQMEPHLGRWYRALDAGRTPVVKGRVLSADDRFRRDVIAALTCNHQADVRALAAAHGVDGVAALDAARPQLAPLVAEGIATIDGGVVGIPERGRLLVRNVAMAFDAYLAPDAGRFSRVI
ncbi:MAG: oxygen-independent coproporphyrinogen III oxidase [Alphaproteobacteria bacterium]|nr:oxygen-independent coproporphyrinogen III oxidase [Alphaproteobacteria bacterium]